MERKLETGWRLPEFVVILNTELKASWCLLEMAGNQRADRARWRGQRTSSTERELSKRQRMKTSERHKEESRKVTDRARQTAACERMVHWSINEATAKGRVLLADSPGDLYSMGRKQGYKQTLVAR